MRRQQQLRQQHAAEAALAGDGAGDPDGEAGTRQPATAVLTHPNADPEGELASGAVAVQDCEESEGAEYAREHGGSWEMAVPYGATASPAESAHQPASLGKRGMWYDSSWRGTALRSAVWTTVGIATIVLLDCPQVALALLALSLVGGTSAGWLSRHWGLWLWCFASRVLFPFGVIEFIAGAGLGAAGWKLYCFSQVVCTGSEAEDSENEVMAATKARRNKPRSSMAPSRKVKTADERVTEGWGRVFELMIEQGMAGVGARQRLHIERLKKELEQEKQAPTHRHKRTNRNARRTWMSRCVPRPIGTQRDQ